MNKARKRRGTPLVGWAAGAAAVALIAVVAATTMGSSESGYTDVEPDELAQMLGEEDVTLVNVHVPYEGELPDTDAFIPYDTIAQQVDMLPADPDAPIVLYCRTGNMSEEAATTLTDLGYTNVYNLEGGFVAWGSQGYEVR